MFAPKYYRTYFRVDTTFRQSQFYLISPLQLCEHNPYTPEITPLFFFITFSTKKLQISAWSRWRFKIVRTDCADSPYVFMYYRSESFGFIINYYFVSFAAKARLSIMQRIARLFIIYVK